MNELSMVLYCLNYLRPDFEKEKEVIIFAWTHHTF